MADNIILLKNEENIDLTGLIKHGDVVKVEGDWGNALYRFAMVKSDNTVACRALGQPLSGGCVVGGLLHITWHTEKGDCTLPVKVTGIGGKGEVIVMSPLGNLEYAEKKDATKVKPASTVHLRLQFEGSNSRYNSIEILEMSGGGITAIIYSRVPVGVGLEGRLEIDLYATQARIPAHGVIIRSEMHNSNSNEYLVEIDFVDIEQTEQQKLIEYVAWEQRTQADEAERTRQRVKEEREKEKEKLQKQKEKEKEKKKRQKECEKKERQEKQKGKPKKPKEKKPEQEAKKADAQKAKKSGSRG